MSKKNKTVKFGKECSLCSKQPIVGLMDLSEEANHIAVCEKHLKSFCEETLDIKPKPVCEVDQKNEI